MTSLLPAAGGTAEATAAGAAGASDGADGADDLRTLVLGWLATKRSVHTRRAYASDLAEWLTWCDSRGAGPLAATEALAAGWARHLEARGLAASTVARRLSCVSSWYSWLVRGGHSAGNPAAYLARPDVDRDTSTTPGLTRDQALALIAAADQARGPQAARTSALIAVLLLTGARVSELTGADLEDLGTDRGHRVLRVTRKGGRRQALGVPAPAVKRLDAYLAARGDLASLPGRAGPARDGAGAAGAVRHAGRGPAVPRRRLAPDPAARPVGRAARRPGEPPRPARDAPFLRHAVPGRRRIAARPAGRHGPRRPPHHPSL